MRRLIARPPKLLASRHCLITGASSGIGAALARLVAREKGLLTLSGRDEARLAKVASECAARGARVRLLACDVTARDALSRGIAEADTVEPLDVVVANAGIGGASVMAPPHGESAADVERIFDVNLLGVVNTIAPAAERFSGRQRGRIVIVGSMMSFDGLAQAPAYCASKAAVRIYGLGLRRLLEPKGIAVTVVSPGFVATPMSASLGLTMPFLVNADEAARRIVDGVARGRPEVLFPWQLRAAVAVAATLPPGVTDRIIAAGNALLVRPAR